MEQATLGERAEAARLVNEHEMGELFKVIAFAKGLGDYAPLGFAERRPAASALGSRTFRPPP